MIKGELEGAAFQNVQVHHAAGQVAACRGLISEAQFLASHGAAVWHTAYAQKLRATAQWVRRQQRVTRG